MRTLLLLAVTGCCFGQQPADLRALVKQAMTFTATRPSEDYLYTLRSDRKEFDSSGKMKSQTTNVAERTFEDGVPVFRVVERNGKPLSDSEKAEQEGKLREQVSETKNLSPQEREKRRKKASENEAWLAEMSEALDYKYLGDEAISGRPAHILACSPRPGYSAKNVRARLFEKMTGKLWIDKTDRTLVRAQAEIFDTVNVGFGILGRVEKGTKFAMDRQKLPDGIWVLKTQYVHFGARVLMVKWIGNEINMSFSNYRHRLQSKVQAASAAQPSKQ